MFDERFLLVGAIFMGILNIAVIAQKYNLIAHTYGYQISVLGVILITLMIVISAYRHGFYKT